MGLTIADLDAALADERHLGFGFAQVKVMSRDNRMRLYHVVLHVANELGLDRETLFHWTNSKHGRWLVDGVYGRSEPSTRETVQRYLNADSVAQAQDFGEIAAATLPRRVPLA